MKGIHYICDKNGKRLSVLVPLKQYKKLISSYEELQDIILYDTVKAKNEPSITLKEYLNKRRIKKST